MRKLPLILAGAALFDLGTVVVGHAAAVDYFLKLDGVSQAPACRDHMGKVVAKDGGTFCQLPAPAPGYLKVTLSDLLVSSKAGPSKAEMHGSAWLVADQPAKK